MTSATRITDYAPALIIIAVLLFLAATGAGIYGWSLAGASALLAWTALITNRHSEPTAAEAIPWWQRIEWVSLALLGFLVLVLLPLPLWLTTITGPHRFAQNSIAATRLRQAAVLDIIDLPPLLFSTTRNRAGTLRVLAICIGALGAARLARSMPLTGRRFLLRGLILGGTLVAWAGSVSLLFFPQGDTLWWKIPIPHVLPGSAACFINQNHFGGFTAMLCPAAIIMATADIRARRWPASILMVLCALLLGLSVPLCESRGGVVAGAAALVVMPVFLFCSGPRKAALWMTIITMIVLLTLSVVALPRVADSMREVLRPTQSSSLQSRMAVWRDWRTGWHRYPIVGSGPNSFHTIYPMLRQTSVTGHRTHAENMYVETVVDSGIAGTAIALWAAVAVGFAMRRARRQKMCDPFTTYAVMAALVVVAVHALVEFAIYVPLYALTLSALIGLALPPPVSHAKSPAAIAAALLALGVTILAPLLTTRDSVRHIPKADISSLARSIVWAPTSQHAWFFAGRQMARSKEKPVRLLGERFMTQSMEYDPMNYRHWRDLGELRWKLKDRDGARQAYEQAHALREWVRVPPHMREAP